VKRWDRVRGWYRAFKRKAFIQFGELVRQHATAKALKRLKGAEAVRVLVDSSILAHAITHESAWVSTGTSNWGPHKINTGYSARVPVYAAGSNKETFRQVKYLPGIAHVARLGFIELLTSAELGAEQDRQPTGRFHGYYLDDMNQFAGIPFRSVDGRQFDLKDAKEKQLRRVSECTDPLFQSLLGVLGEPNSLDAFHIFTAEKHDLDAFLHFDLKLDRLLKQHRARLENLKLRTKPFLPEDFGQWLGIRPMDPRWISHEGAPFFVRPDLNLPDEKRRRPPRSG
jgi:hypothetical protein